jgi:hypothetical protein
MGNSNDLTLKQFRMSVKILEQRLATVIAQEMLNFETDTGYTPCSIDVNMVSILEMGQQFPKYIIAGVTTDYDLGFGR